MLKTHAHADSDLGTLINRRNVTGDPHSSFRAILPPMLPQLHDSVGICWKIKCPRTLPPASFKYNGKTRRNHELFHHPRVQFKDSTMMTQSSPECTALQKETKAGDDVYNYNCAILADCFLFFNFLNAIEEGVGERIVQQYKYIMLSCKANGSHSTKYALECLTQFFFVFAPLSQRDSKQFVWNRSVNNSGKKAANIPIDEDTEHESNAIKQGIRNIGPNVTKNAVQRIYFARHPTASILSNLVNSIKWQLPSGKHWKSGKGLK